MNQSSKDLLERLARARAEMEAAERAIASEIVKQRESRKTIGEIARQFGMTPDAVSKICKASGLSFNGQSEATREKIRQRRAADTRAIAMSERFRKGETLASIGADFGICAERVRAICVRQGGQELMAEARASREAKRKAAKPDP